MLGLTLHDGTLALRDDLPPPRPPEGEVRIRVTRAGICATDHGLIAGLYPYRGVLGHEFVGVVDVGPGEWIGRRVVGEINATCGTCDRCRRGLSNHCERRTVLGIVGRDGVFAEYVALPIENLHAVDDEVSDDVAVFTEPVAAALQIIEQVAVRPSDRVLVVGDGRLGQLCAQALAMAGARVVAIGRHERKLDCLRRFGVGTLLARRDDNPECVWQTIDRASFDVAVECTGNESGFAIARAALRPRGTLVLKSTYPGAPRVDATMLVVDEITLVGSRCGPFDAALRALETGRIDVSYLTDATFPLARAEEAIAKSAEPDVLKVTLSM